jgi:small-conductance mechanosensitive channel
MTVLEILDSVAAVARKIETVIPILGYLLVSIVGGAAAFVKEWEDKNPTRTFMQNIWALWRKLFFALVSGLLWYNIVVWQSLTGSPLSYLGATLVGLYSTEFLDFLWTQMKARIGTMGTPKPPKE